MTSKMFEEKLKEGQKHFENGEKSLKKTLTRWKPDFESASASFDQAAVSFKNARSYNRAKEAFIAASNAKYKCEAVYQAATAMENASQMALSMKQEIEGANLLKEGAHLYMENGNNQKAAEVLDKAAKLYGSASDFESAIEAYNEAISTYESDEKGIFAHPTFTAAVGLLLKQCRWADALSFLDRQIEILKDNNQLPRLHLTILSVIVIKLKMDDYVGAEQFYQQSLQVDGFLHSKEMQVATELLDAFEKNDQDSLDQALSKQTVSFLDQQVVKTARGLMIFGASSKPKTTIKHADRPSNALFEDKKPEVVAESEPGLSTVSEEKKEEVQVEEEEDEFDDLA